MKDLWISGISLITVSMITAFYFQKKKIQLKKKKKIFERTHLAKSPAFGYLIGNLEDLIHTIETDILRTVQQTYDTVKENTPFLCVISPPRHGKSLLLDKLFEKNEKVTVVAITYNSATPLIKLETFSSEAAIRFFWLRILKSVLQDTINLEDLNQLYQNHRIVSLLDIMKIVTNLFIDDPFNETKNILICVDEFSKFIDSCGNEEVIQYFLNNLKQQMTSSRNKFIRFIFTGFKVEMSRLLGISATVKTYSIPLCDFSACRPYLKEIRDLYNRTNHSFPILLYECIKSTPGLVGLWAERIVYNKEWDSNLQDFLSKVSWFENLLIDYKENWSIIMNYLIKMEVYDDYHGLNDLKKQIINNQLGIIVQQEQFDKYSIQLNPFVFAAIALFEESDGMAIAVKQAIKCCSERKEADGEPFERFVLYALQARLFLNERIESSEHVSHLDLCRLFPGQSYSGSLKIFKDHIIPITLHTITTKEHLKDFLISPLYFLFPVGLELLDTEMNRSSSNILEFILETKSLYQWEERINSSTKSIYVTLRPAKSCILLQHTTTIIEMERQSKSGREEELHDSEVFEVFEKFLQLGWNMQLKESEVSNKKALSFWRSIKSRYETIMKMIDNGHCLVKLSKDAAGADLLLVAKEGSKFHLCCIEIKDRRYIAPNNWKDKLITLLSLRCVLTFMKVKEPEKYEIHFVCVGREHA